MKNDLLATKQAWVIEQAWVTEPALPESPARGNAALSCRQPRIGFTLMELVVASALLSSLMLGLWGLVKLFTTLAEKGVDQAGKIRAASNLLEAFDADVRSFASGTDSGPLPALLGTASRIEFWRLAPPSLALLGAVPPADELLDADLAFASAGAAAGALNAGPGNQAATFGELEATPPSSSLESENSWLPARSSPGGLASPDTVMAAAEGLPVVRRIRYLLREAGAASANANANAAVPDLSGGPQLAAPRAASGRDVSDSVPESRSESEAEAEFNGEAELLLPAQTLVRHEETTSSGLAGHVGQRTEFADVEAVRFGYFDGRRWLARWNSKTRGKLPQAIRLEVWMRTASPLRPQKILLDLGIANPSDRPEIDSPLAATGLPDEANAPGERLFPDPEGPDDDSDRNPLNIPLRPADLTRIVVP